MSLKLAKAFTAALRSNDDLLEALGAEDGVGARIFAVARTGEDENDDKLPYVIVMPQGVQSEGTKDEYEAEDRSTMDILVCAGDFDSLVDLADEVRSTIEDNLDDQEDFIIDDYSFAAGAVQYDDARPCFWQTLTYIVNTQK